MIGFASIAMRLAPYAITAAVAVGAYHMTPVVGPAARIERLKDDIKDEKARALAAESLAKSRKQSFDDSEEARRVDQVAAGNAVTAAEQSCDARLAEARKSTKIIERIVNHVPKTDANGCPARSLVDPGLLRDALGPSR